MLIERLVIKETIPIEQVIRDIEFNLKGINLIVDNTTKDSRDSGNNIGKSTAIRIIDICLGARSTKNIYYDEDTKTENIEVKEYLNNSKIKAVLTLVKQVDGEIVERYEVVRELFSNGKKIIDGKVMNEKEFNEKLKEIIFEDSQHFPTFRQLIPKFVRTDDQLGDKMLKYLQSTTAETYDTIYLFLLDRTYSKLVSDKNKLMSELNECEKKIKIYSKDNNISSYEVLIQKENILETEIESLKRKREEYDYMEKYSEELEKKRNINNELDNLEKKIQMLEFDINTIEANIQKLLSEKSNININVIKELYAEAGAYIGKLDKTFEEVVEFHNKMIDNRITFIKAQYYNKKDNYDKLQMEKYKLLNLKKQIVIDILDEGLLDEINIINNEIEKLKLEEGAIKQSLHLLRSADMEKIDIIEAINRLGDIDPDTLSKCSAVLNKYFSKYCEELYGEKFLFAYDPEWRDKKGGFPVVLEALKGKVGAGMKKSLTVAFDLAYMMYESERNIPGPEFVIHDKLENTHINQIETIVNICDDISGQYILPILRERIDKLDQEKVTKGIILELSTDDKLFKI